MYTASKYIYNLTYLHEKCMDKETYKIHKLLSMHTNQKFLFTVTGYSVGRSAWLGVRTIMISIFNVRPLAPAMTQPS